MINKNRLNIIVTALAFVGFIVLVTDMLISVSALQGSARVVNYAGIVRGATQRLVKNEMYGAEDDAEIARLDNIIQGLRTGRSNYSLNKLKDDDFQDKLDALSLMWADLKDAIMLHRADDSADDELYRLSESYFTLADETVSAAEVYADGRAAKLRVLELLVIVNTCVMGALLLSQIYEEFRRNRQLKSLAYMDANTGLPSKRSCEERLAMGGILGQSRSVCCLMFDLNNLKTVNDTMGHKAGDCLIASFASALRRAAGKGMFVGRFGGDEFIGIMEPASRDDVNAFLRRLDLEIILLINESGTNHIDISYACGYAFSCDNNSCSLKSLMDVADKNMYADKAQKKAARAAAARA